MHQGSGAAPSLSRLRLPSSPMHSGKCSPLDASSVGELAQPGHKSQDSSRPEGARREAATGVLGTCGSPAEQRQPHLGRPLASAQRSLLTEVACPRAFASMGKSNGAGIETISTAHLESFLLHQSLRVTIADSSPNSFSTSVFLFIQMGFILLNCRSARFKMLCKNQRLPMSRLLS